MFSQLLDVEQAMWEVIIILEIQLFIYLYFRNRTNRRMTRHAVITDNPPKTVAIINSVERKL